MAWNQYVEEGDNLIEPFLSSPLPLLEGQFLSQFQAPMNLCAACKSLNTDRLLVSTGRKPIYHQPNYIALITSAVGGCEMCKLFLYSVLEFDNREESKRDVYERIRYLSTSETEIWANHIEPEKITQITYFIPLSDRNYDARATIDVRNYASFTDRNVRCRELSSMPNFRLTTQWIHNCVKNHKDYSINHGGNQAEDRDLPELPTRIIDVGIEGVREPHLLISSGARANYVTLSHCWGQTQPFTTLAANLQKHLVSIPFSGLPRTFQDAVTVTRELGYQFLWVDSICIIQDSKEDWERECVEMAGIYMRAIVTIAGTRVTNMQSGFLERQAKPLPPHIWEYQNTNEAKTHRVAMRHQPARYPNWRKDGQYPGFPQLVSGEGDSPLDDRGWVLQEFMLSPRLLLFGQFRVRLECQTCTQFEDYEDEEFTELPRNRKKQILERISSNQRAEA